METNRTHGPWAIPPCAEQEALQTDWVGKPGALFGLALKTALLTILTLGLYRFWMRTQLRRWYWSCVRPGGDPLEYTGTPQEKLLGFLWAITILVIYIGFVNLLLLFVSFSLFSAPWVAYLITAAGVVPVWFYAQYRAHRYMLARTRWRGIRFGLEPGAWGYAWVAIKLWTLTLLTLGYWWPHKTFWLEKYKADRTYFGTAKMEQAGNPTALYEGFRHILFSSLLIIFLLVVMWAGAITDENLWLFSLCLIALTSWFFWGIGYYSVFAQRYMASHKSVAGVKLLSTQRPARIIGIYVKGYLLVSLILGAVAGGLIAAFISNLENADITGEKLVEWISFLQTMEVLMILISGFIYFLIFLAVSVLWHVFVLLPIWQHKAETLSLHKVAGLTDIRQRSRDEMEEAEGFAEALGLGGSL